MSPDNPGVFVTLDGPGGAGKSTATRHLHDLLVRRGYRVHATTQPSRGQLGEIARHGTDTYSSHALACLVAADRYHHLTNEIRPQLASGAIVLCDRYVASSYVLQRMDGVPVEFIEAINAAADVPQLAVILTADPEITAARIARRGAHSRFEAGVATSQAETALYHDAASRLTTHGYPLHTIDTTHTPITTVAAQLAQKIAALAALPHPQHNTA